jgi:Phage stabilisation protein
VRIELPASGVVGQGRNLNANTGECLNCYIEVMADGSPALVGCPGTVKKVTLPNAPVRGCYSDSGISYWVAGNGVYKVGADFGITFLGNIGTYNGHVQFASSSIDLMLVDGTSGWSIKLATGVMVQITDPDFPANPIGVVFSKGYFVVTPLNSQQFYISQQLNIATLWSALDFATAEGRPDKTVAPIIYQDELILVGYKSMEVWDFTGNADFPYQRNGNAVIDHGTVAPYSMAKAMDSVYWLGGDNQGQGIVWRLNGYTPERISTHEIEQQIARLPYIGDAFALSYQQDGHNFYILQFPSSNYTLAYDVTTGLWHRRSTHNDMTGQDNFWRASCICFSGSLNLVGDIQNGNIYALDLDTYTDNGGTLVRQRTSTTAKQMQVNVTYGRMVVQMQTGVGTDSGQSSDPKLAIQWSNDNGHTWSNWRYSSMGKIGQYGVQVAFNLLGMGRNRVWRLRCTDPVKFVLLSVILEAEQGYA